MTSGEDILTIVYALGRSTHLASRDEYRLPAGNDPDTTVPNWPLVSRQTLQDLEDWTGVDAPEVLPRG